MAKKAKTPIPRRKATIVKHKTGKKTGSSQHSDISATRELKRSSRDDLLQDPSDLHFSENHEWIRVKDRQTVVIGLTDFVQTKLSDIITVEIPEPDDNHYDAGDEISVIEALNGSVAFHAPIAGTVVATNMDLLSRPELINTDPYGGGWLIEMRPDNLADVFELMDADEYEGHLPEEEEE